MKPLVIYGTGGHAAEVLDLIDAINTIQPTWQVDGFLVDASFQDAPFYLGYPVLGDHGYLQTSPETAIVIALGNGQARQMIADKIRNLITSPFFPTLIHPEAIISSRATLGEGIQICAQSIIQARASIADHVIINVACSISHDCTIGPFATLAPGARLAGNVTVASHTSLGIGVVAIPGVHLGQGSIVGAGAVLIRDVPPASTVAGNPATRIGTATR